MINQEIEQWFHEYHEDVYHYLQYYTTNFSGEIDDLVQEVFIKAMKGYKNFNRSSSPKTWLFTIARNTAIDYLRKKKIRSWLNIHEHDVVDPSENSSPGYAVFVKEDIQDLINSMKKLKNNYREIIILRVIKDFSVSETADILRCSESKVNVTLHRALKKLRDIHVNEEGGN